MTKYPFCSFEFMDRLDLVRVIKMLIDRNLYPNLHPKYFFVHLPEEKTMPAVFYMS